MPSVGQEGTLEGISLGTVDGKLEGISLGMDDGSDDGAELGASMDDPMAHVATSVTSEQLVPAPANVPELLSQPTVVIYWQ